MPTILEFHLQPDTRDCFNVTVFERDSSQPLASAQFSFPLSDWMTKHDIAKLEFNLRDPQGRLDELRKFGGKLYQLLFTPAIQQLWQQARDRAEFLTLCLRIDDAAKELEALPWETLHDGTEFLAAGAKTTVTRLPLGIVPPRDLPAIPSPLRMLALVSSPPDLPDKSRLNVEAEQELILEAVNAPAGQGKLHVDFEDEAKLAILESSLEAGYHILHFTGHGVAPNNGGGLLLEDPDGKAQVYGTAEILQTLEKGFGTLRLAVLSGCNTAQTKTQNADGFRDLARALADRKVPAVLAMQFKISDGGGLKLAEVLYPKLVAGQTLEVAVNAARRALLLSDDPVLQGDALAMVLLVADGNCLQTKAAETPPLNRSFTVDTNYQLGTLPQLGFGFYGRRREYRQLRDAMGNHRAVIIHGIGGIGKTSLSAHAADRLYHRRKRFNGVYAFDCSGGTLAPERILLELHRYFAMQGENVLERFLHQPMEPEMLAGLLAQVLTQTPLLLLFDNFETQLERVEDRFRIANEDARRFLAALVKATAQNTRFLFTSRFLFDLDERLGDVASVPLGDLSRPEAFSVMLKLPRLAKASYDEKGKIYDTFGGHPFALVALDKYCQTSSVDKALQNAKAVHVKLREHLALELNYAQLTEQARELLNRLAAFRVAVPMEAAEWVMRDADGTVPRAVATGSDDDATKSLPLLVPYRGDAVRELIEWGLLTPVYEDDALTRVDVHSLVRDFCRDKQPEEWRDRLREAATFYTNQARRIPGAEKTPAMVWGEMEAFELLIEAEEYSAAANLLFGAHELLTRWGFGRYLESQYTRMLDQANQADTAGLMHNFGMLQQERGNYEVALDCYQRSLKIAEDLGNVAGVSNSLHQIGMVQQSWGNHEEALDYYQRSLKIKGEMGNVAGVASSLHQIGIVQQERGNYEAALDYYQRALKIREDLGDVVGLASALHQIGTLHQTHGNYEAALDYYQQSLKIAEDLGDVAGIANSLHQTGTLQQSCGNYEAALGYYQQSLKIAEDLGDVEGVARSLYNIGTAHQDRGNYESALDCYRRSLKIAEDLGIKAGAASSQAQIGKLLAETGEYAEAFGLLLHALGIFIQLKAPNAGNVANMLRTLRGKWNGFDAAWRAATGEDVPGWLGETTPTKKKAGFWKRVAGLFSSA